MHFLALPDEVIQRVLYFCYPEDIYLNVKNVCQRLFRLASEPLLWRYYCRVEFRYWDARHSVEEKFRGPIEIVNWKSLYSYRRRVDLRITQLLNSILDSQINRISKYEAIASFGYDAKDTLLRHIHAEDNVHDVLARRYYANSILDHVHRAKALDEWQRILIDKNVPLERVLVSFELFILHDRPSDFSEISETLDEMTQCLRFQCPGIDSLPTRAKVLATTDFMRRQNLTGIVSHWAYRNLQSIFIGIHLEFPEHPPMPLISVAIFCALGRRIGLDARGCGASICVHVVIFPRPGETIDSKFLKNASLEPEPMYLDPYRSMEEVPLCTLINTLSYWGLNSNHHTEYLSEMSMASVILRMSKIILESFRHFNSLIEDSRAVDHSITRLHLSSFPDVEKAHYLYLWADVMFSNHIEQAVSEMQQSRVISVILEKYERFYPMDSSLIEKHILSLNSDPQNPSNHQIVQTLRAVRNADQIPKPIRLRRSPEERKVKYKVGQVFRHKRYFYTAVIFGWDPEAGCNFDWVVASDANPLPSGRYQSFYHALVEDSSIRYVAEENIEIIEPEYPATLMNLAGKYFKRWNPESHTFVSAIRDEYPED